MFQVYNGEDDFVAWTQFKECSEFCGLYEHINPNNSQDLSGINISNEGMKTKAG